VRNCPHPLQSTSMFGSPISPLKPAMYAVHEGAASPY
jgi:hypothetical protein